MKVQNNAYVALEYTLSLDSGDIVDQSEPGETMGFIFGEGQIIPGLERQLEGLEKGQSAKVVVEPAEGYGERDPELVHELPRARFPEGADIHEGMMFEAQGPFGVRPVRVSAVKDDAVTIDFNHPLAGQRLHFDVKLADVRDSTDEDRKALHSDCDHEGCHECGGHEDCGEHEHEAH